MTQNKKYLHFDGVSEEVPKDKDGNYEIKAKSKKIGERIVETDEGGCLICTSKEIKHPDGRIDVEIHVPTFNLKSMVTGRNNLTKEN